MSPVPPYAQHVEHVPVGIFPAAPTISDELWALFEPVIRRSRPVVHGRTGRPQVCDRDVLEGIAFVLATGIGWAKLPTELRGQISPGAASAVAEHDALDHLPVIPPPTAPAGRGGQLRLYARPFPFGGDGPMVSHQRRPPPPIAKIQQ